MRYFTARCGELIGKNADTFSARVGPVFGYAHCIICNMLISNGKIDFSEVFRAILLEKKLTVMMLEGHHGGRKTA